jgi:hypothetical protein
MIELVSFTEGILLDPLAPCPLSPKGERGASILIPAPFPQRGEGRVNSNSRAFSPKERGQSQF